MSPTEFWESTLRDVVAFVEAFAWRQVEAQRDGITVAWLSAAFYAAAKVGKLKALDEYTGTREEPAPMSPETELLLWDMWANAHNARLGIANG